MIKRLIYIFILLVIVANTGFAEIQNAHVQYNGYKYFFKKGDKIKFLKNANRSMLIFENSKNPSKKTFYLRKAMKYYFLLSQINPKSVDAQLGLGKVYDELNLDKYAKEHFFCALNIDKLDPRVNFHFANFYYKRKNYIKALYYFKEAYTLGGSQNYEINRKIGIIYEKLADIESAKKFYANACIINPTDINLRNKIRLLDDLNYYKSQYYLYRK